MTTDFETRQDYTITEELVIPIVLSISSLSPQTPGSIAYDKSTGLLSFSNGQTWTIPTIGNATPTSRGKVLGSTPTSGATSTGLGSQIGTVPVNSTFIGFQTGRNSTSSSDSTAIGTQSLIAGTGVRRTALGSSVFMNGANNRSVGIGQNTMRSATITGDCTAAGNQSQFIITGSQSTSLGSGAMGGSIAGIFTNSVALGYNALNNGSNMVGSIAIGNNATPTATSTSTNTTAIGAGTVAQNGSTGAIILGTNASGTTNNELTIAPTITQWRSTGLAAGAAANTLQIAPGTGIITQVASSRRFKEDIEDLDSSFHERLQELLLRSYLYNGESDHGLIAEEAYEVFPELVTLDEKGHAQGVKHLALIMALLGEVQELEKDVQLLKMRKGILVQ